MVEIMRTDLASVDCSWRCPLEASRSEPKHLASTMAEKPSRAPWKFLPYFVNTSLPRRLIVRCGRRMFPRRRRGRQ